MSSPAAVGSATIERKVSTKEVQSDEQHKEKAGGEIVVVNNQNEQIGSPEAFAEELGRRGSARSSAEQNRRVLEEFAANVLVISGRLRVDAH